MRKKRWALPLAIALGVLFASPIRDHIQAANVLTNLASAPRSENDRTLTESDVMFGGQVPARIYRDKDASADAPAIVLVHGVHRLGIDEPRLVRFARAIAHEGFTVMTPLVRELADYKVDPASIATVENAISYANGLSGGAKVGVIGFSFGGGIALLAASSEKTCTKVNTVLSVGGHDDLERVSTFFVTDRTVNPRHAELPLKAHDYGPLVIVYARADSFFPGNDAKVAADSIRLWLWEQRDDARAKLSLLSPESRAKLEKLFDHNVEPIRDELRALISQRGPEMALVSPHGHLGHIRANVFVLHGAGDSVIPATEAEWLAGDVPLDHLGGSLVSPALVHVELGNVSTKEKWDLLHFFARTLGSMRQR